MNVLFAPDYRRGLPYQGFLARELKKLEVDVDFMSHYRRGFPLARGASDFNCDILHIHWPEVYFSRNKRGDGLRKLRYPYDLGFATRHRKLFLTAHNLLPHNRHNEWRVSSLVKKTALMSDGIFVHSEHAQEEIVKTFGVSSEKCFVIPYGDHADGWGHPLKRSDARSQLGLDQKRKLCLIFGTVSPYKGSDEVVKYWIQNSPDAQLIIAGPVINQEYANLLKNLSGQSPDVELRISDQWMTDEDLHKWLSAVDCTIFNYRDIFTSGAAALARSMGVPILIPQRLQAADLHEPHRLVHRFDSLDAGFDKHLKAALAQSSAYDDAEQWRKKTSWKEVARITKQVYERVAQK